MHFVRVDRVVVKSIEYFGLSFIWRRSTLKERARPKGARQRPCPLYSVCTVLAAPQYTSAYLPLSIPCLVRCLPAVASRVIVLLDEQGSPSRFWLRPLYTSTATFRCTLLHYMTDHVAASSNWTQLRALSTLYYLAYLVTRASSPDETLAI